MCVCVCVCVWWLMHTRCTRYSVALPKRDREERLYEHAPRNVIMKAKPTAPTPMIAKHAAPTPTTIRLTRGGTVTKIEVGGEAAGAAVVHDPYGSATVVHEEVHVVNEIVVNKIVSTHATTNTTTTVIEGSSLLGPPQDPRVRPTQARREPMVNKTTHGPVGPSPSRPPHLSRRGGRGTPSHPSSRGYLCIVMCVGIRFAKNV